MALRQAYAVCPEAVFLPSDDSRCREVLAEVLGLLESYSPLIEIDSLGCAYLDVTGVSDEEAIGRQMLTTIFTRAELRGCVGISGGKFFSHVAAITSTPETPTIVPCGEERDFIAPLSIDFLPSSAEAKERLHNFGIRSIAQLTQFSREALVAQFGSEGTRIHELAHGIDGSLLIPKKQAEVLVYAADIEPPTAVCPQLLHRCQALLEKPLQEAHAHGKVCRELQLRVSFASGALQEKRLPFKEPTASINTILCRIHMWLESISFPAPATGIELSLWLTGERGKDLHLLSGRDGPRRKLRELAGDLKARFGHQPLKQVCETDPDARLPERRFSLTDVRGQG
jgi:DNA polymerase-4